MALVVTTKNQEKTFQEKEIINIGTGSNADFIIPLDFDLLLTVQHNIAENKFVIMNTFSTDKVLFKGKPIGHSLEIENMCKLMIDGSDDFISIKVVANKPQPTAKTASMIANEDFTEDDIKALYGTGAQAAIRIKIEKQKADLEKRRVSLIKEISYVVSDLKKRIDMNSKVGLFLHIVLFFSSLISAFAVSNYLMGLSIQESKNYLHLPTNIKVLFMYAALLYGICLMLKQGIYLFLQNKITKNLSPTAKISEHFMLGVSSVFILATYAINLIYYMNPDGNIAFALLISAFFVGMMATLAIACGYFKSSSVELAMMLDKYEYREDFECLIKEYQEWIHRYINNLSKTKIEYIKNKMFTLELKSLGEMILGIFTAPFLAYGVSNTLAMCFPEAAGWIRISGLRFSPVFLTLATFLIIFAFLSFVNSFLASRKIQASEVLKQDGFSNHQNHGVDIFGVEGIKKLDLERIRSLTIAVVIIFIEFSMNISYFMTEIGGDLQGIFLSIIAALVPTALLIAETYMLSQTKFHLWANEELISKIDKD
jgi:hypothetical protein